MNNETPQQSVELKQIIAGISDQIKQLEDGLDNLDHDNREKGKEFIFLQGLVKLISRNDLSLSEGIQEILDLIPPLWQYPDETGGRIKIRDMDFKTTNFINETSWRHSAEIIVRGEHVGEFEIFYNEGRPDGYRGVMIWEDRQLIDAAALGISLFIEIEEARNYIGSLSEDLEMARRAAKEYESQFYNYAARIKALKSRTDDSLYSLRIGMRNIGNGVYMPLKTIYDLSKELNSITDTGEINSRSEKICTLSNNLLKLAGNVIEYVNLETGYFRQSKVPFSLRGAIEGLTDKLSDEAREKGIEITAFIDPLTPDSVIGDEKRLCQITENLVQEAIQSDRASEIIIRAEVEVWAHLLPIFHFSVCSGSRVISENQKGRFFDLVTQDEDNLEDNLGIAYGLAVAKNLAESMGGEMWIESPAYLTDDSTPGSAIHFTLWMDVQKSQDDHQMGSIVTEDKGMTALIIDDRFSSRTMICSLLENWGWRTIPVDNSKDAEEALHRAADKEEFCDLVLLDIELPDMRGVELVRKISECIDNNRTALVLLSYNSEPLSPDDLKSFGIRTVVQKPIKQNIIFKIVAEIEVERKAAGTGEDFLDEGNEAPTYDEEEHSAGDDVVNRILFVSHDRLIQLLYKGILEKRGYTINFVENPEDLDKILMSGRYVAVLFDLAGANRRLIDAIGKIRGRDKDNHRHTLLIGIMSNEIPGRCEKFREVGLDECIVTANGYDGLYGYIERCIKDELAAKKEPEEKSKAIEVNFDPEKALAAVEGDHDLMYEIIDAFEEESGKYISSLERALDSRDIDEVEKVIGGLISISKKFGIGEINDTAEAILTAVGEDNFDEARDKVPMLSDQIANLEKQLSEFEQNMIR